jgi:hypothetical protein
VLSFLVTLFFTRVKKRVTRSSEGGVEALAQENKRSPISGAVEALAQEQEEWKLWLKRTHEK